MPRLTLEEALEKPVEIPEREFEIPLLKGSVLIRAITNMRDITAIEGDVSQKMAAQKAGMVGFAEVTVEEIVSAAWVQRGVVDPPMDDFGSALKFIRRIGGSGGPLLQTILEISGMGDIAIDNAEEALISKPFFAESFGAEPGVPGAAPVGTGPDDA